MALAAVMPWLEFGTSVAGLANAVGKGDMTQQIPAGIGNASGGGKTGQGPMADFFSSYTEGDMSGSQGTKPPQGLSTSGLKNPEMTQPKMPTTQNADSQLQEIDMKSLPKRKKNQQDMHEIGDVIASIPEALALAGSMLGFDQDKQQRPVGAGGGMPQNAYAGAFGPLPKGPSLGELLASMPRVR
jgi:hypothetical protein